MPFNASYYLDDDDDDDEVVAECLTVCLEDPNPDVFLSVHADVANTQDMAQVTKATGLGRESRYKALTPGAHPRHETIRKVVDALGLKMTITPAAAE